MIRFLQFILRPLERIERGAELVNLMARHDAVVVGVFNFTGNVGGPGFHTFYSTALKFLERDPHREVSFAVVTNKAAAIELGVFNMPVIRLYMWNETVEFVHESDLTVEGLTKWISHNIHQVTVWITPPGVKSLTLSPYVEDGSVMVLFTPRNPLHQFNHYYDLFREVGLEYYNCDNDHWVNDLMYFLAKNRAEMENKHKELEEKCSLLKEQTKYSTSPPVQIVQARWINESSCQVMRIRRKVCTSLGFTSGNVDKIMEDITVSRNSECKELLLATKNQPSCSNIGEIFRFHDRCCDSNSRVLCNENQSGQQSLLSLKTSMLTGKGDDRSASALTAAALKENCRRLRRAQSVHSPVFARSDYHNRAPPTFRGLACRTNKTLSLLAMDSLQFHQFAEGLGIDILARNDKTGAIIFNAGLESAYILERDVSKDSLMNFIMNFTEGTLNRSLRSSANELHSALNQYPELNIKDCKNNSSVVCVQELSSDTFMQFVMDQNHAAVVLYHSPYCAFCHAVSHHFLTLERYFRAVHNLTFARIDGENNDLPWEFTMHHYPTVLFFPAVRKSESRVFPQHLPVTVSNLVNFILGNLGPGIGRLEGMIALCVSWEKSQDDTTAKDCIDRVRSESIEVIANMLLQYRTANFKWQTFYSNSANRELSNHRRMLHRHSKVLLVKLQLLKEINLLLGSVHRLNEKSSEYKSVQIIFERYHKFARVNGEIFLPSRQQSSFKEKRFIKDEL
ncbi:thioredoxin domain-containing protein 11 isoform X2 [Anabrus simplex]